MEQRRFGWSSGLLVVLLVATVALVWLADRTLKDKAATAVVGSPASAAAPAPSASASTATRPTAVFVGDGYTAGTDGHSWADLVSDAEGWREVNLAVPGMGFRRVPDECPPETARPTASASPSPSAEPVEVECTPFGGLLDQIQSERPQVVVVMGGAADGSTDPSRAIDTFFEQLATAVPDARVYAVNPVVSDANPPAWVRQTTDAIEAAAAANDATFVDIGQPLSGERDLIRGPAAPTASGHEVLAEAFLEAAG